MATISERLRTDTLRVSEAFTTHVPLKPLRHEAAETIDALVAALSLVKSMRFIDALSPAEHEFEITKRREAWAKIDQQIDAAIALAALARGDKP